MIIETLYYSDGYKAVVRCDCQCLTDIKPPEDIEGHLYSIAKDGMITAKEGYAYDFATGAVDTDTIKRASLFHDIVCQAIREGKLDTKWQAVADQLFKDICLHDDMSRFRARYAYKVVRKYQIKKMAEINAMKAELSPEKFKQYLETLNAHPIKSVPRFSA